MRKETREVFVAFDGSEHSTAALCRDYEHERADQRLAGLTVDQLRAAFSRQDIDLADAIEAAGERCKRARLDAGDLRRRPKDPAAPPSDVAIQDRPVQQDPEDEQVAA